MSSAAVLAMFSFGIVSGADWRIDHVTVAGSQLAPMRAGLEKAGIRCEYGGPHSNHATEMAVASFPDGSYLELIAFQKQADPVAAAKHAWSKYMQGEAGPCAWAIRSPDAGAEAARLRAAGIPVSGVNKSGRIRPDGFRLDWETVQVGSEGNGVYFPFLIHDFTPRLKRAFPGGKPLNPRLAGVSKVVIAVRDLDQAIARYRKAYDLPEPLREGSSAWFLGTPVILRLAPERVKEFGEGVSAFLIRSNEPVQSEATWFGKKVRWLVPDAIGAARLGIEEP